jgi:hypothetical protein
MAGAPAAGSGGLRTPAPPEAAACRALSAHLWREAQAGAPVDDLAAGRHRVVRVEGRVAHLRARAAALARSRLVLGLSSPTCPTLALLRRRPSGVGAGRRAPLSRPSEQGG